MHMCMYTYMYMYMNIYINNIYVCYIYIHIYMYIYIYESQSSYLFNGKPQLFDVTHNFLFLLIDFQLQLLIFKFALASFYMDFPPILMTR